MQLESQSQFSNNNNINPHFSSLQADTLLPAQILPGINNSYLWKAKKTTCEQTQGNQELLELHARLHCAGSELEGLKVLIFVAQMATNRAFTNLIYPVGAHGQI